MIGPLSRLLLILLPSGFLILGGMVTPSVAQGSEGAPSQGNLPEERGKGRGRRGAVRADGTAEANRAKGEAPGKTGTGLHPESPPPTSSQDALQKARSALGRGYPRRALEILKQARDLGFDTPALEALAAQGWLDMGRPDLASPFLTEVEGALGGDPEVHALVARSYSLEGRYAEAEDSFLLALDGLRGKAAAEAFIDLGNNYRLWGDPASAEWAYLQAADIPAQGPSVWASVGIAQALQGKLEEAEDSLDLALTAGEKHPIYRLGRAMVAMARGQLTEAVHWLLPVSRRNDVRGIPRLFYGDVLRRLGRFDDARRVLDAFYTTTIQANPHKKTRSQGLPPVPRLHAARALVLLAQGEIEQAEAELRVGQEMDPADSSVLVAQARMGDALGHSQQVEDACFLLERLGVSPLDVGEADGACQAWAGFSATGH